MKTVAILGASGFVGSTLFQRMRARREYDVRPVIHSSGNAWGLARHGIQLWMADLSLPEQIRAAIDGCPLVVNCTYTPLEVMAAATRNLIRVCREVRVERLVHLSSTALYGDPPPPESVREDARPRCRKGSYGWHKLRQDDAIRRACRAGLPSVILCPPNISGPHSPYLLRILDRLRAGRFALVEDGRLPCVLVDVVNLAAAIERALVCPVADGERTYVTDDADLTWNDLIEVLRPLAGVPRPPSIAAADAERLRRPDENLSVLQAVRRALSLAESRAVLKQARLVQRVYDRLPVLLPGGIGEGLVRRIRGSGANDADAAGPGFDDKLCAHQLYDVRFSCQRAKDVLGYRPVLSGRRSLEVFARWYRDSHGMDSDAWPLVRHLYGPPG